ncbi:granzyme A-like isoform X1 [Bufo gargarizans]|uniref:granzyme A-like isoform X1 n=2 Tax=Bufo gargarizans TaxID=30331 RepID=UPI001CF17629|nr:granzyme A-like isoform X1 [Bufo gargarizans]
MLAMWNLIFLAVILQRKNCDCARIVGGEEARSTPYMALVRTPGKTFCGGVLIKPDWVLTSAECFVDKTTTVDLGVRSIKNIKDNQRQQFKVVKIIAHEKFNKEKHVNNLQLLKLLGKVNITKAVNTVLFPEKFAEVKPGSVCTIAGWGRTDNKKPNPADKLMEARVTVIDRKTCASQWKPSVKITKDMMCTNEKGAVRGFCNGDAGGPIICGGFLKGIISFGPMLCGTSSGADVYTRLTKDYMKWIKKKTKGML